MLTSVPRQGRGGAVSTLTTMINGRRRSSSQGLLSLHCPGPDGTAPVAMSNCCQTSPADDRPWKAWLVWLLLSRVTSNLVQYR